MESIIVASGALSGRAATRLLVSWSGAEIADDSARVEAAGRFSLAARGVLGALKEICGFNVSYASATLHAMQVVTRHRQ
jgi:hypothetical protein